MHLGSAAAQQVNQSCVEGHDGVSHVNGVIFFLLHHVTTAKDTQIISSLIIMCVRQINKLTDDLPDE